MSSKQNVVAIDGPSGSGKSTVAKKVSKDLELLYIDTGSMFRALGYYLKKNGLDVQNLPEKQSQELLDTCHFEYAPEKNILIRLDREDLTEKIREHEVSELASFVSRYQFIRTFLAQKQREIALKTESVLEGRDIGTVIFPQAKLKIFLTASSKERAKRRYEELKERGEGIDYETILHDIEIRDQRDSERDIAPLCKASDAVEIDTSGMSIEEVVQRVKDLYQELE